MVCLRFGRSLAIRNLLRLIGSQLQFDKWCVPSGSAHGHVTNCPFENLSEAGHCFFGAKRSYPLPPDFLRDVLTNLPSVWTSLVKGFVGVQSSALRITDPTRCFWKSGTWLPGGLPYNRRVLFNLIILCGNVVAIGTRRLGNLVPVGRLHISQTAGYDIQIINNCAIPYKMRSLPCVSKQIQ